MFTRQLPNPITPRHPNTIRQTRSRRLRTSQVDILANLTVPQLMEIDPYSIG